MLIILLHLLPFTEDLHYSSDSGVDASSVSSSCDSVVPQSELSVFPQQDAAIITHCKKVPTVSVLSAETGARRKSDTGGYNHAEVVRYLWESWMVVQEKCKQGRSNNVLSEKHTYMWH